MPPQDGRLKTIGNHPWKFWEIWNSWSRYLITIRLLQVDVFNISVRFAMPGIQKYLRMVFIKSFLLKFFVYFSVFAILSFLPINIFVFHSRITLHQRSWNRFEQNIRLIPTLIRIRFGLSRPPARGCANGCLLWTNMTCECLILKFRKNIVWTWI